MYEYTLYTNTFCEKNVQIDITYFYPLVNK